MPPAKSSKPKPFSLKQIQQRAEGQRQYEAGDYTGAAATFRDILRKNPSHPDLLFDLASAQMQLGQFAEARQTLERMIRVVPRAYQAHVQMALCHGAESQYQKALEAVDRALAIKPDQPVAVAKKAEILHLRGDHREGYELLKPLVAAGDRTPEALFEFGRLATLVGEPAEAESTFERLLARERISPAMRADARFELAAAYDRLGAYDRAWDAATEANAIQGNRFDPAAHDAMIDRVIETWTKDAVAALPRATESSERPVFIVGMPRSGTSLVEQILASHPEVYGAGELSRIYKLVAGIQPHESGPAYIDDLSLLTQGAVDRAARAYAKDLARLNATAARVTDKQPFNFLYLGLIALMFPRAHVIHCVRHPLDVAVSCFLQSFRGTMYFATNLEHIADFTLAYERLMAHWRDVLDLEILDVEYEALTGDQEAMSRRIVEFVGLDWDDACLRFHESRRMVWTASIDQVRRPMYRSSVARWRHYAAHLEPVRARLGVSDAPEAPPAEARIGAAAAGGSETPVPADAPGLLGRVKRLLGRPASGANRDAGGDGDGDG